MDKTSQCLGCLGSGLTFRVRCIVCGGTGERRNPSQSLPGVRVTPAQSGVDDLREAAMLNDGDDLCDRCGRERAVHTPRYGWRRCEQCERAAWEVTRPQVGGDDWRYNRGPAQYRAFRVTWLAWDPPSWDRGLGDVGKRLTDAAHAYGSSDLYVHRGRIHVS